MNQTYPTFQFNNFMTSENQKDHKPQIQIGFIPCFTFNHLPLLPNIVFSQPQKAPEPSDAEKVNQKQMRIKLIQLFRKDKKKYNDLCDKFIDIMQISQKCQIVRAMIDFITKTTSQQAFSGLSPLNKDNAQISNIKRDSFYLHSFSNHISFVASIFSRDKVHVLLQLHSSYQKIQNYLHFLFVSIQSFSFTNQKQWILMKDQIERYLIKYEKNINKMLEINEINLESESNEQEKIQNTQNIINRDNIQSKKNKQRRSSLKRLFGFKDKDNHLEEQINLKNYKKDINTIKKKIKQLQGTMCAAIRNSFHSWYQKFQVILDQIKDQLNYVCMLLQKAQRFQQSEQKDKIIQFLLITRSKGVQGIIFLQQIYKCILVKLQQSRQQLTFNVSLGFKNKPNVENKQSLQFILRQQATKQDIDKLFLKFQKVLNVKSERRYIGRNPIQIIDQSQSDGIQKVQSSQSIILSIKQTKQPIKQKDTFKQSFNKQQSQQIKKIPKNHKITKQTKKQRNIVLKHTETLNNRNCPSQISSQKKNQNYEEKSSSSLQYLIDTKQVLEKISKSQKSLESQKSQKSVSNPQQKQKNKKSLDRNIIYQNLNYGELQSLSIQNDIDIKISPIIYSFNSISPCEIDERSVSNQNSNKM